MHATIVKQSKVEIDRFHSQVQGQKKCTERSTNLSSGFIKADFYMEDDSLLPSCRNQPLSKERVVVVVVVFRATRDNFSAKLNGILFSFSSTKPFTSCCLWIIHPDCRRSSKSRQTYHCRSTNSKSSSKQENQKKKAHHAERTCMSFIS